MEMLSDSQGRQFRYLRLSLTEACNFRCSYCLPQGYKKTTPELELSLPEISRLLKAFSRLSFQKVRLTGGEPTLRKDLFEIIAEAAHLGYRVALTTNGYRLEEKIATLKKKGLSQINISLDSLCSEQFKNITGKNQLQSVLGTIDEALAQGIEKVKINTVLLKGFNEHEFEDLLFFVKDRPLTLRFIELMQTRQNEELFRKGHIRSQFLIDQIESAGWRRAKKDSMDGPAEEFHHPDSLGKIGFISPYQKDFCAQCNRLRVSSRGDLRLCLFGQGQASLRSYLQEDSAVEDLVDFIQRTLRFKPKSHGLQEGDYGDTHSLSTYGG